MRNHDPRLKVAGSFIDVSNTTLTTAQPGVSLTLPMTAGGLFDLALLIVNLITHLGSFAT